MNIPSRAADRALWSLALCQMVMVAGHALSFPFFALYLTRVRGLGPAQAGAFMAASMLISAAGFAWGGDLSDVYGRKRVMAGSLFLRALLVLCLALAVARDWSVSMIFLIHSVSFFVGNFFFPAARSWIADHHPAAGRVEAYGFLRMASNVGWAAGPALGGMLAAVSYPALFIATSAVLGACSAALPFMLGAERALMRPAQRFSLPALLSPALDRRYLFFTSGVLLISAVMAQLVAPLSMYASAYGGISESRIGFLFSINGAVVVLAQWPVTRLMRRARMSVSLVAGSLLYAAGYASVGSCRSFAAFAAAVVVISLGEVTVSPAIQTLSANLAPERMKGRFAGFCGLMEHLGYAVGPLAGGLLQQRWGRGAWGFVSVAGIAAALGFFATGRMFSDEEEGLSAAQPVPAQSLGGKCSDRLISAVFEVRT
ncbi:MAG: MFS transporter [Elusimicrobiota bacterium]|jgi:MFS family permease